MPKQTQQYEHEDQLGRTIEPGHIVAVTPGYSRHIHIGRVVRVTRSRVRIALVNQYRSATGELTRYDTEYQAHPDRTLILTDIEQELTVLSLKGLLK